MIKSEHLVLREQSLPPASEWSPTGKTSWLFLRVQSGDGLVMQSATPQLLTPNDVVVCPPASVCQVRASQLNELRFHFFHVDPELLGGVLTASERQQLGATSRQQRAARWFDCGQPIARSFEHLSQPATSPLQRRFQMLQLAAPILSEHLPELAEPKRILSAKARFEELFQKMPEAELQNRKPEELARLCGCSVRHFSRLFRDYFGHSLMPKKTELRIQKAQQLLVETDAKIIDVALDCGFQHVSQFTAIFRRFTKLTPSEYRRRKQR